MEGLAGVAGAFTDALQVEYLLYALIGCVLGTAVGVLPGLGPSVTMALLLPIVFRLGDPLGGLIMFAGIFYGAMYGGSTTSILLSTPGESSSAVTVLDGYRMTKSGRGGAALLTSAVGSFVAGVLATIATAMFALPLTELALILAPQDFFALALFALASVAMLGGQPWKAAFSGLVGLALGTIGVHASTGVTRFTFGQLELYGGIDFELVAIGMFAVAEVVFVLASLNIGRPKRAPYAGKLYMTADEWRRSVGPWLRGSVLGFFIGVIPGPGTTPASFLSYSLERGRSKTPDKFGHGMIEGVAGPEAANNAASSGSMVPLLAFGIPGSPATAIMLGALIGFGVPTGPLLMQTNPDLVFALIASFLIANIMLLVLNVPMISVWVQILRVPPPILYPLVLVVSALGVFSLTRTSFDLLLMAGFGVVGMVFQYLDVPLGPALLALILGPLMENYWGTAITSAQGSWSIFWSTPISIVLYVLTLVLLFVPLGLRMLRSRRGGAAASP